MSLGTARDRLWLLAVLVFLGASLKSVATLVSGSRAVLVDALTCFASLAALAAVLYYLRAGEMPPDEDHPYGHYRLRLGGVLVSLSVYMFVAGYGLASTLSGLESGYRVEGLRAVPWLVAGTAAYAAAVALSRGMDPVVRLYAGFTVSEIIESLVSLLGAVLGQYLGYVYDAAGAFAIIGYIFYEAVEAHRYLLRSFSDVSAPRRLYQALEREAALRGLRVIRARLRMLDEERCAGEAVVAPPPGVGLDVADLLADEVAEAMRERGCDVVIHVGYAESRLAPRTR